MSQSLRYIVTRNVHKIFNNKEIIKTYYVELNANIPRNVNFKVLTETSSIV